MEKLSFKKSVDFVNGGIYSVCLRGARRYHQSNGKEFDIYVDAPNFETPEVAHVVSQKQFRFCDLSPIHVQDNYNPYARTLIGLQAAMNEVYESFEPDELVTILRFKIMITQ